MTSSIDRALERLENDPWPKTRTSRRMWFTSILTDLAAEKYNEGMEYGSILRCRDLKARLAAVEALGEEWLKSDTMGIWGDHLLELVGGEGGSDD